MTTGTELQYRCPTCPVVFQRLCAERNGKAQGDEIFRPKLGCLAITTSVSAEEAKEHLNAQLTSSFFSQKNN